VEVEEEEEVVDVPFFDMLGASLENCFRRCRRRAAVIFSPFPSFPVALPTVAAFVVTIVVVPAAVTVGFDVATTAAASRFHRTILTRVVRPGRKKDSSKEQERKAS
jgi:hypothetical protein